jgi:oxygen-independent coproporphyrinogen-3 oxidase
MLRGQLVPLGEQLERTLYEMAIDGLQAAGWRHYEVSNFARPGFPSRHNLVYWTGRTYFAAGAGAARHVAGRRETNHRSVSSYLRRVLSGRSPVAEAETLPGEAAARERLVLGLRMLDGVRQARFQQETGFSVAQLVGPEVRRLVAQGLLEIQHDTLRLTREGLMISDSLWPDLLRI